MSVLFSFLRNLDYCLLTAPYIYIETDRQAEIETNRDGNRDRKKRTTKITLGIFPKKNQSLILQRLEDVFSQRETVNSTEGLVTTVQF